MMWVRGTAFIILLAFGSTAGGASGDNIVSGSLTLSELESAIDAHRALIHTAQGSFTHIRTYPKQLSSDKVSGRWRYKEGAWYVSYDRDFRTIDTASTPLKPGKTRGEVQILSGYSLDVTENRKSALISKTIGAGALGYVGFDGIDSYQSGAFNARTIIKIVGSGKARLRAQTQVLQQGTTRTEYLIDLLDANGQVRGEAKLQAVPSWQYSVPVYETWSASRGNGNVFHVTMERIGPDGIWFPKKSVTEQYEGKKNGQSLLDHSDITEYSETQVNVPINSSDLDIVMPANARVSSTMGLGIWHLQSKATLSDLISGRVKSDSESGWTVEER